MAHKSGILGVQTEQSISEQILHGTVRYDGTDFAGWQIQPGLRTVQGALESALFQIAQRPVPVQGASRTDSGVHAFGQSVSFRWGGGDVERLRHALSKMLSPEIQVTKLIAAPAGFNARFAARGKRYSYTLDLGREPDPLSARFAWHVPYELNRELLRELAPALSGTHDFAGFQSRGGQERASTVCTLYRVEMVEGGAVGPHNAPHLCRLVFEGYGFLYRMVRNMSGTLVEIARGRFSPDFLHESLHSPGPFRGHCAPAHGLVLETVYYDGD